jgi:glycosyltransferase involved in cell wall biosynthesis
MPQRLAILGTRGVPANYGGFETFAEQLSTRLVARGHEVTVFGRSGQIAPALDGQFWRGVRIELLPAPRSKHLETVVHTLRSALRVRGRFDAALVCNGANFLALPLLRAAGLPTAVAVDGIESARRKWGPSGRAFHATAQFLVPRLADVIVADCDVIEAYYRRRGARRVRRIAYGAEAPAGSGTAALTKLGVRPGGYVLYVSRLEPENNADVVIRGFLEAGLDHDLVVVGDAPYADGYKAQLRRLAGGNPRIHFAGYVFGEGYDELRAHAAAWVQATEVGGTHPALLEAMAAELPIAANDIPEHREVLGDAGLYYTWNAPASLAEKLRTLLAADDPIAAERSRALARAAGERVRRLYDWQRITGQYEELFECLAREGRRGFLAASGGLG